jgi:hypothetical protein
MQKLYEVWYIAGFAGDINGTSEVVTEHELFNSGRFDYDDDGEYVFFSKWRLQNLYEGETVGPATFVTYTMAVKRIV